MSAGWPAASRKPAVAELQSHDSLIITIFLRSRRMIARIIASRRLDVVPRGAASRHRLNPAKQLGPGCLTRKICVPVAAAGFATRFVELKGRLRERHHRFAQKCTHTPIAGDRDTSSKVVGQRAWQGSIKSIINPMSAPCSPADPRASVARR